jgi:hypothetical protein
MLTIQEDSPRYKEEFMHQPSDDFFFSGRGRIWRAMTALLLSTVPAWTSASVAQPSNQPSPTAPPAVAQPSTQPSPTAPPALNQDPKAARIPVQPNPNTAPPQGVPDEQSAKATIDAWKKQRDATK